MKLPVIKHLVQNQSLSELEAAEAALSDEQPLAITVEGDDEGEQLTHVLAAIYIKNKMDTEGLEFNTALREYTKRVRTSIS